MSEKYVRKVVKKLQCSGRKRKEIERQLTSELLSGMEDGENLQDVMERMGMPGELAEEFNSTFTAEEKKKYKVEKWTGRMIILILAVLILAGGLYWYLPKMTAIEESKIFDKDAVEEKTEQVIQLLDDNDYSELKKWSSKAMQEVLNEAVMREAKNMIGPDWGKFQSFGNAYMTECRQMGKSSVVVQINASYENANVTYTITFDEEMIVEGIWMK